MVSEYREEESITYAQPKLDTYYWYIQYISTLIHSSRNPSGFFLPFFFHIRIYLHPIHHAKGGCEKVVRDKTNPQTLATILFSIKKPSNT